MVIRYPIFSNCVLWETPPTIKILGQGERAALKIGNYVLRWVSGVIGYRVIDY